MDRTYPGCRHSWIKALTLAFALRPELNSYPSPAGIPGQWPAGRRAGIPDRRLGRSCLSGDREWVSGTCAELGGTIQMARPGRYV